MASPKLFHSPLTQPDFSADDLLWVLYIMYSLRALSYLSSVTPWDELPGALAHARRCVAKACDLRPKLPYGFEVVAKVFKDSRMVESSYVYADKVCQKSADPCLI